MAEFAHCSTETCPSSAVGSSAQPVAVLVVGDLPQFPNMSASLITISPREIKETSHPLLGTAAGARMAMSMALRTGAERKVYLEKHLSGYGFRVECADDGRELLWRPGDKCKYPLDPNTGLRDLRGDIADISGSLISLGVAATATTLMGQFIPNAGSLLTRIGIKVSGPAIKGIVDVVTQRLSSIFGGRHGASPN